MFCIIFLSLSQSAATLTFLDTRAELDWPIFISGRTETWRNGRRILDGSLRPGTIMSYRQGIQEKTYELLAQLRESPNDFRAHVRLSVCHPCYIV
jgi:hypothetical protein